MERYCYFVPGIPCSFRARCASVLCNELFNYLAPPHCFSWLCALFTACLFWSDDKAINLLVAFYFTVCMLLRYTLYLFSLCPCCVRGMILIQTVQVENEGTGTRMSRFSIISVFPASSVQDLCLDVFPPEVLALHLTMLYAIKVQLPLLILVAGVTAPTLCKSKPKV